MPLTFRRDLNRILTPDEVDANFDYLRDNPDGLRLPKIQNVGIRLDPSAPRYAWRDLRSKIYVVAGNPNAAGWATYRGGIKQFQFVIGREAQVDYHIDHDHVIGSDLYIHVHWSHNSSDTIGGNTRWGFEVMYANRGQPFGAPIMLYAQQDAGAQWVHQINEIQLSTPGGGPALLDSAIFQPDGLLLTRVFLDQNNLTASGSVPDPFAHYVDLHYQSTGVGTINKEPDFWI